jgi:uncharacterized protein (UPF0548 family)
MFIVSKPSNDRIQGFIDEQSKLPFSYSETGQTRGDPPPGYSINRHRRELGKGEEVFNQAVSALRHWRMYELSWTVLCWPDSPVLEGTVVAVLAQHYGFWSLNACRVVYVLSDCENDILKREAFAIGTLPDHAETGEERFSLEWDRKTNIVTFDVFAFARHHHILARLGAPVARLLQRRFARESGDAMGSSIDVKSFQS